MTPFVRSLQSIFSSAYDNVVYAANQGIEDMELARADGGDLKSRGWLNVGPRSRPSAAPPRPPEVEYDVDASESSLKTSVARRELPRNTISIIKM